MFDLSAALRALFHQRVREALDALKAMTAFFALIFVKGHVLCGAGTPAREVLKLILAGVLGSFKTLGSRALSQSHLQPNLKP